MRDWPEFIRGEDYSVELRNSATKETVTVKLDKEDNTPFVSVHSSEAGSLFDRVAGRVIYALSEHSDDLMVERYVTNA